MVTYKNLLGHPSQDFRTSMENPGETPSRIDDTIVNIPQVIHEYIRYLHEYEYPVVNTVKRFGNCMVYYSKAQFPKTVKWNPSQYRTLRKELLEAQFNYEVSELGQPYEVDFDHEPDYHGSVRVSIKPGELEWFRLFQDYTGLQSQQAALRHLLYFAIVFQDGEQFYDEYFQKRPVEIALRGVYRAQKGVAHHNRLIDKLEEPDPTDGT